MSIANHPLARRAASERGSILIQVGIAILVISAFAMFVFDYGVAWVSRSQAQNSADAGAIAGATALAYDDFDDRTAAGPAKLAARGFALQHVVWGEQPDVKMDTDVRFYPDAPGAFPAMCANDDCVRVDVYRNQTRNNPLPVFFGWLVGLTQQGVRASAIAQAAAANASDCLKPWAIADKWAENNPVPNSEWETTSTFDPSGENPDVYIPQNGVNSPGTSFTLADVGTEFTLKVGHPGDKQITPGWFQALDLPCDQGGGASCYEDNIRGCTSATYAVDNSNIAKENGAMAGPTKDATADLIALDPNAEWDPVTDKVIKSCVGPPYSCSTPGYKQSPRIVAIPVFDTQEYWDTGGPGNGTIHIRQILGFFVDRLEGKGGNKDVVGYLATTAGLTVSNGGSVAQPAAFMKTVQLVR
jgi:Flp pilus assembly protein TadG